MRRIRVSDPRAQELVEAVTAERDGMPVRALEAMLASGEAGFGMLVAGLRGCIESRRLPLAHWCAVGLGAVGDPDAAPELTLLLRWAWRGGWVGLGFAAAEALGRMGASAEEALLQNARLTLCHERFWFHYAAARMATDGAAAFLLDEVERNLPLADSAALALADIGRADALPAIGRSLKRLKRWQATLVEPAVVALHRGDPVLGGFTWNWRLRYRYCPGFGLYPPLWPCLTALLRSHRRGRAVSAQRAPARSIEEILARAEHGPRETDPCGVCGAPGGLHTGVVVCDACAPAAARVQADCMLGVDCTSNDLFDVLDAIDTRLKRHDTSGLPLDDGYRRHLLAHAACHWLVEQRIETVAEGAAALLADACSCSGICTCATTDPDLLPMAEA